MSREAHLKFGLVITNFSLQVFFFRKKKINLKKKYTSPANNFLLHPVEVIGKLKKLKKIIILLANVSIT